MVDERHIEWLLAGQEIWNDKRQSPNFRPNFRFANLAQRFDSAENLDHNGRVSLPRFDLRDGILLVRILAKWTLSRPIFVELDSQALVLTKRTSFKRTSPMRTSVIAILEVLISLAPTLKIRTSPMQT